MSIKHKQKIIESFLDILSYEFNEEVQTSNDEWLEKEMWKFGLEYIDVVEVICLLEKDLSTYLTDEDINQYHKKLEDLTPKEIIDIFLSKFDKVNNKTESTESSVLVENVYSLVTELMRIPGHYKIKNNTENDESSVCITVNEEDKCVYITNENKSDKI